MTVRVFSQADYHDAKSLNLIIKSALELVDNEIEDLKNKGSNALIVIKPNWVQESHELLPDVWEPVITHPFIIVSLVEELALRVAEAEIVICDAPHTYASFESIIARGELECRLNKIVDRHPGLRIKLLDLRREVWERKDGVVVARHPGQEDPRGYIRVDLADNSLFYGHSGEGRYYGADYDSRVVNYHHFGNLHEYLLAATPMRADLFINIPKMKTHKKTGITCALKNLVGINGDKNWLPHHTEGSPKNNGDEFGGESVLNSLERMSKTFLRKLMIKSPLFGSYAYRKIRSASKVALGDSDVVIRNGNWSGNDTCWRMALDLNRSFLFFNYADNAVLSDNKRACLNIVDGVIAGEGNGPLCPDPVHSGVIIAGRNPADVDAVVARLMGYDPKNIKLINNAFGGHKYNISDTKIDSIEVYDLRNNKMVALYDLGFAINRQFIPHFGWKALSSGVGGYEY